MSNDPRSSREFHQMKKEIDDSLKVSSYLGHVAEAMKTGQKVPSQGLVPNYSDGDGAMGPQPMHMNMDSLFSGAVNVLGEEGVGVALQDVYPETDGQPSFRDSGHMQKNAAFGPTIHISENQQKALEKFPALIEVLGQDDMGDQIAEGIANKVREIMVSKIFANTKEVNKTAEICIVKNKNIKMYFKGPDWVSCITASGPFRGDEIMQYHKEHDKHYILRRSGEEFDDVTNMFNVVHETNQGDHDDA